MEKNLLLLSSSRVGDSGYLEQALPDIKEFLSGKLNNEQKLLFIPFAGISVGFDQYEKLVQEAFAKIQLKIQSIHHFEDKLQAVNSCCAIITGGGNTFSLLNDLYLNNLIEPIQDVINRGVPYIGWSAGSNIAAPTIRTTNDMPIVEPTSFEALNLLPWQINPHYIEGNPAGHNGETRQQRLEEFLIANPKKQVIALPEGSGLKLSNGKLNYFGKTSGWIFNRQEKMAIDNNTNLIQALKSNDKL